MPLPSQLGCTHIWISPPCRLEWGGSRLRPEATGFGAVFFAKELLEDGGDSLVGKRCLVSGSG